MERFRYDSLQLREVFHLEFLRWLGKIVKTRYYVLKGGTNLRFFFNSFRYSEDMDLDVRDIDVAAMGKSVMKILESASFQDNLKPFGIESVIPPDISKAKQTQTTQRFKVHLITFAGEDLFTKIEFSRRGFKEGVEINAVSNSILRAYKLPPILVPHYDIRSTLMQKVEALASRATVQARDIFDIYILHSQFVPDNSKKGIINNSRLKKAHQRVFEVSFNQYRDTVLSYLSPEDQALYGTPSLWDEIRLKAVSFIEELKTI